MVTTVDLLGTTPFGESRIIINTNTDALASEINNIETIFGMSLTAGSLDLTANTGGVVKALQMVTNSVVMPVAGTSNIVMTGSTGDVSAVTVEASTSMTTPVATIASLTVSSIGATFNSPSVFNSVSTFNDGISRGTVTDLGTLTYPYTHTVINADGVLLFNAAGSVGPLTLAPGAGLVDGHTITMIYYGTLTGVTIPSSNIVGTLTVTFSNVPYKSAVTLTYSAGRSAWYVTSLVNATLG